MTGAPRILVLYAAMAGLILAVGTLQSWTLALTILNLQLISAVMALGVNMQWGYAGLFNVGIMGFAALGGVAAVLTSMPPVPGALSAGGWNLGLAALAIVATIGAALFVRDLTDGQGTDGACECVGTVASWDSALDLVRPGGTVGWVGVPHGVTDGLPIWKMFGRNVGVRGGVAPARAYLPDLLPEVLSGALDPGPIFTDTVTLDEIAAGYRAMDERRAIKVLVRP